MIIIHKKIQKKKIQKLLKNYIQIIKREKKKVRNYMKKIKNMKMKIHLNQI